MMIWIPGLSTPTACFSSATNWSKPKARRASPQPICVANPTTSPIRSNRRWYLQQRCSAPLPQPCWWTAPRCPPPKTKTTRSQSLPRLKPPSAQMWGPSRLWRASSAAERPIPSPPFAAPVTARVLQAFFQPYVAPAGAPCSRSFCPHSQFPNIPRGCGGVKPPPPSSAKITAPAAPRATRTVSHTANSPRSTPCCLTDHRAEIFPQDRRRRCSEPHTPAPVRAPPRSSARPLPPFRCPGKSRVGAVDVTGNGDRSSAGLCVDISGAGDLCRHSSACTTVQPFSRPWLKSSGKLPVPRRPIRNTLLLIRQPSSHTRRKGPPESRCAAPRGRG